MQKYDILERIAASTRLRVDAQKDALSLDELKRRTQALPPCPCSFGAALAAPGLSLICEVKKASPSKGLITQEFDYLQIARDYETAGAASISVLTEPEFFQGSDQYLEEIAAHVKLPVLRKDFTIDPYQIYQAKALGASAILLICALLDKARLKEYHILATSLGLDALVECRDEAEVAMALEAGAQIIGVNNRDLRTFTVDINTCLRLRALAPKDRIFVAESGIAAPEDTRRLMEAGVDAALIGETLMRAGDKAAMIRALRGEVL